MTEGTVTALFPSRDLVATLVRPGMPTLTYGRQDGALTCSRSGGEIRSDWMPCLPPVRVVVVGDDHLFVRTVAPGVDFPIDGDVFEALTEHVGRLGLRGTLLTVLDATPTLDELIEALEAEHGRSDGFAALVEGLEGQMAVGHVLGTTSPNPFAKDLAPDLGSEAARAWLTRSLEGIAWNEVPAGKRNVLARAESALDELDDGTDQDAFRRGGDVRDELWLLGCFGHDPSSPWDCLVTGLAGRWSMLQTATSVALDMRGYARPVTIPMLEVIDGGRDSGRRCPEPV